MLKALITMILLQVVGFACVYPLLKVASDSDDHIAEIYETRKMEE